MANIPSKTLIPLLSSNKNTNTSAPVTKTAIQKSILLKKKKYFLF